MNAIWIRSLISLVMLAVLSVLIGTLYRRDVGLATAVAGLLVHWLLTTYHTQRLWRVLDAPMYGDVPSAAGIWGEIYYRLYRLAKRWHAQVRDVEVQHERFIDAIQVSPNGIIMLDDEHRIVWCNANAERQFGLDAKRDLGQHITHLIRHPAFIRYLGSSREGTDLRMSGMGRKFHKVLSVQVFPYGDSRKMVISNDVTKLERTDAMRRDFVANVSHELKTPLTVLAGFLETVRELPLADEERMRYLGLMDQQSKRMEHIVSDLLVLAHIEADPKAPGDAPVDIARLMRHLRDEALGLSAERHAISFTIEAGLSVTGAEGELASAFGNLLTNAVRYTPVGGEIHVRWWTEEGGAVFSVSDDGIGIPVEHIPRLTERFYRVDRSRSRDTGGTGLGLAIVKHVLQRHEARLSIRSQVDRGSTFTIHFPPHRSVPARAVDAHASAA
ncbi:phosphate regulon sensor histidine kinase PhoR [Robbsia sp. Bb-Pol-6]|uniref:Phosphate regulon sensor protein PhoR n=1 Tax=Robbsia betulipollinis TaxID=2981849 RepID=A0ABT3ZPN6_9BURK|nr:phosphate regulon sensor histidine kinase PhoR [Robbsia betulipollinis]MCY0388495.1 phosphate regulon sensor histidine kinase PhoR [Robbsia betulipollinis]